ncbi:Hsp70 family protein [bacterium]|nr:Hsp70 family protein [bacterium]
MGLVLGIDLGTSTTTVSVVRDGMAEVLSIPGEKTAIMPSVVSFLNRGNKILIGSPAKKEKSFHPETTIYSIKRIIGRKFSHPETIIYAEKFPYNVVQGDNDSVEVDIFGKRFTPQQISAMVLMKIRKAVQEAVGEDIRDAVITVPANYNEAQRRATQEAGRLAGLNVIRIINEPTAAALAYGFGNSLNEKIAVYDFGGGTFDITVLEVKDNFFEVLSTGGDSFLGGDDMDDTLAEFIMSDIESESGIGLTVSPEVKGILRSEAERIKIILSEQDEAHVIIKNIVPTKEGGFKDYRRDISRDTFDNIMSNIIQNTLAICDKTLENAHVDKGEIDAIVLVGGSTKVPFVQLQVEEYFGKAPFLGIETELVISMGASILGSTLSSDAHSDAPVLMDVVPLSLGVGSVGDYIEILVEKNDPLPLDRTTVFTNASDNQNSVVIEVYQGDEQSKQRSHLMGKLLLSNLRKAQRGELKIEVTFDIDTNGVLHVSAVDIETGKLQKIELNILGLDSKGEE